MAIRDWRRWTVISLPLLALGGVAVMLPGPRGAPAPGPNGVSWATVCRLDLDVTLRVPGRLDSAQHTLIECEIERMSGSEARGANANRYSTLLSVVPEGTYVKQGDVLCEIDPAGFVELVRKQQIAVDEDWAGEAKARLELEAAAIALEEYRDGLRPQTTKELEAQLTLARANLERQTDRMEWARRMQPLGYISSLQFEDERQELLRCQVAVDRARWALDSFERYTAPKTIKMFESQVEQLRSTYGYWKRKRELDEQTLALYERQVEICTIRAPHEGYVIYCVDDDDPPIAPGIVVRRHMDLFHLPDLSQLEVHAEVNQTVIWRIAEGLPARVRLDAVPDRVFEGRITHIPALPDQEDRWAQFSGVSNYIVRVRIEADGVLLLPGMSAQVEILADAHPATLVIPAEALAIEDGQSICYVAEPDGLERRPVTVAPGTIDLLRVTGGLSEGEKVVLDPADLALVTRVGARHDGRITLRPMTGRPPPSSAARGDS